MKSHIYAHFIYISSAVNEVETSSKKEIIVGGRTILTPKSYMKAVVAMDPTSERANIFDTDVATEGGGSSEANHPLWLSDKSSVTKKRDESRHGHIHMPSTRVNDGYAYLEDIP